MVVDDFFKDYFCLFFDFKSIYVMNRIDPARPDRNASMTRFWHFTNPKVTKIGTSIFINLLPLKYIIIGKKEGDILSR